ncbi:MULTISPECIES: 50S ribosomal protein L1 [Holospora]|uniref:Large ribosomal subunit protein uL1 n=2 Tax=Holospora TaxID=44747 RepID=A0A061JFX6_9PROT|nr:MULTISPECIES: 50S ribosomal protein L1 [Holospora]ETZ04681.1 50S ribosomal protein L1 [Holospora undulata HU1]GAJ46238.1 50S ribosomal protein L1 [Holospora elegans E1]
MKRNTTRRLQLRDEGINFQAAYSLSDAVSLLQERGKLGQGGVKFDPSVEFVFKCNVNTAKSDQAIRSLIPLPHGTGKTLRVAVFADHGDAQEARSAGADIVGGSDLIEEVKKGKVDFDFCIATPNLMAEVGTLGRILGPRGLMPTIKTNTVTKDVGQAVRNAKFGQVEIRPEKAGIVHGLMGRLSFSSSALEENFLCVYHALQKLRPSESKGEFVKKKGISSTMGFCLWVKI